MTRLKYPTRLSGRSPLFWLADAWAKTHHGEASVAFLGKQHGPRVMPWAVSNNGHYVIELWSTLKKIHRRKNGFSHAVEHLRRVEDTMTSLNRSDRTTFEIWEEPGDDPIDNKLIEQWAERTHSRLIPVTTAQLLSRLDTIEQCTVIPQEGEPNPLFQRLSFRKTLK